MIPVKPQPAPARFFEKVQQPGEAFLVKVPQPKSWKDHEYWRAIQKELYEAYSGICAYSCHRIKRTTGSSTVEHFKPKSKHPHLAYTWTNYRLVCGKLNGRKGNYEDVLDPFTLQGDWFIIKFPSLQAAPNPQLSVEDAAQVMQTIKRLKLNGEDFIEERQEYLQDYCVCGYPFSYLEREAPFLAQELKRQNLVKAICDVMRF